MAPAQLLTTRGTLGERKPEPSRGDGAPRGAKDPSFESMQGPNSWRILAVEDSASARRLIQEILLRLGISLPSLRLAGDPGEATRLFEEWRPNVVLLDMDLGRSPPIAPTPGGGGGEDGLDGRELGRRFLKSNPALKLVIVTALDLDSPPVKELQRLGATAVITKPVLAARVREVLSPLPFRPALERTAK
jgi:CheY-like chemotaxis protein